MSAVIVIRLGNPLSEFQARHVPSGNGKAFLVILGGGVLRTQTTLS